MLRSKRPKEPNPLKIIIFGEELVGKTCFIDMLQFLEGKHFISHGPVDSEPLSRTISYANETWSFSFIDLNLNSDISPRYREVLNTYIASADGVVLLYDVTSLFSFDHLIQHTYLQIWQCRNTVFFKDGAEGRMQGLKKRFGCVVVGNKKDIIDRDEGKRQVKKEMADQWASSQGFRHIEISSNERKEVEDAVQALVDSMQRARRMDARDIRDSKSDVKGWSKKIGKHVING
ncbi:hypothetical protein GT037_004705 [Alternaria burnsii]|uniref:P-loop containing nucleoside triphosphate hydrolase protein n=1 Tax=Alternaria burnsii TaxID=1187904 RepID=A0A8H7EHA8_9PLEO|nr:uncharacterized protein GT037_004705 [Alternaria burnsii]KAF7677846.1 hypothetical protein GT037_004705 [Alternaria burnsii]